MLSCINWGGYWRTLTSSWDVGVWLHFFLIGWPICDNLHCIFPPDEGTMPKVTKPNLWSNHEAEAEAMPKLWSNHEAEAEALIFRKHKAEATALAFSKHQTRSWSRSPGASQLLYFETTKLKPKLWPQMLRLHEAEAEAEAPSYPPSLSSKHFGGSLSMTFYVVLRGEHERGEICNYELNPCPSYFR